MGGAGGGRSRRGEGYSSSRKPSPQNTADLLKIQSMAVKKSGGKRGWRGGGVAGMGREGEGGGGEMPEKRPVT